MRASTGTRLLLTALALIVAAAIWLPQVHRFWNPQVAASRLEVDPAAVDLARHLESVWLATPEEHAAVAPMREVNPEWDFMGRTFFVLGEANLALQMPERRATCLEAIDRVLAATLLSEEQHGMGWFLLDYHQDRPWVQQPPRSLFVDGEIALCLGARRLVDDSSDRWRTWFRERIELVRQRMESGGALCAESYPDECWMFCNTAALAALRMSDALDGTDHSEFFTRWVSTARERLIDPGNGLLISAFDLAGRPHPAGPGAEGSSIWFSIHMLQLIDPTFAREQYELAKEKLASTFLSFGYSREWARGEAAKLDIDSGITVPGLGASPSASGLALVAARAFDDTGYYSSLRKSLDYLAFPAKGANGGSHYRMAGAIGNPVIFYSMTEGPLWALASQK